MTMRLTPGTRIRRYEIESAIGAGGMGEVYLARDVELGRTVALKVLPPAAGDEADRIRRFLQEAKAAIALNHPNIAHIYDAGDENGVRFMAMEYVAGQTLRDRMNGEPLGTEEAIDIVIQIAAALASAHAQGIVHRDIKPENVMLRPDGYVKVLDFGLAKLTGIAANDSTQALRTDTGVVMGTVHYMSPEQLRAEDVDARADVFSTGVLLYELASGQRPFVASSPSGVIAAILTTQPRPLEGAPAVLNALLAKAMAKKREDRHADAGELLTALKSVRGTGRILSGDVPTQVLTSPVAPPRISRRAIFAIAAVAVVAILSLLIAKQIAQKRRVERARLALPRIEELTGKAKFFEAWDLAKSVEPDLPGEARLVRALERMTSELSVSSTPPGAKVYLQRFLARDNTPPRVLAGVTPLVKYRVPHGDYLLTLEKEGFPPLEHPISRTALQAGNHLEPPGPLELQETLRKDTPPGMVFVPGGNYRLGTYNRPTSERVKLDDFFIDRYEVSNRDFERFVVAGGYRRPELWKHPFVRDGKTLSFEEAMAVMRDATGLAGPRSWARQKSPAGRENHPVSDITWYEAAAFAEWAGKKLPTLFEWDKAARDGGFFPIGIYMPWGPSHNVDVSRRANFNGNGPLPVDSMPFGASRFGAHHMAGNVNEWCRNPIDSELAARGGAWDSPVYGFVRTATYPPFYSAPTLGFRCVKEIGSGDQGGMAITTDQTVPSYEPVSDADFEKIRARYAYDRSVPLDARVLEVKDAPAWKREKISYRGAGGKTAFLYLYLPKGFTGPRQVIHFGPPTDIEDGHRSVTASAELGLDAYIRAGRAVLAVVLEGYLERPRPAGWTAPDPRTAEYADEMVERVTDLRRALDYLETRPEIDSTRLVFFGISGGSFVGTLLTGVEPRYRATFFQASGIRASEKAYVAEANRINFAPRVSGAVLMLNGRYDESHPLRTNAEPLFKLFRGRKRMELFEGGHSTMPANIVPIFTRFADEELGRVKQ